MQTSSHLIYNTDASGSILINRIRVFTWVLMACWTLLISISWLWNFLAERKVFHKVALAEAHAVIERDTLYRRWCSSHGGIYAPSTQASPPNAHLSHIPERDIRTPSGKQLTLINPAYMTRQVNELAAEESEFLGRAHLTSLKPLRPDNAPDEWEEKILRGFETNRNEVSAVIDMGGKPYMRLMKPFITVESCLKCHASQGYTIGSMRGGISVSIPIQPLLDASRGQLTGSFVFHGIILLLGLSITAAGSRQLSKSALLQKQVENDLHQQAVMLEEEIAERQIAQESLQESESHLRIVADYSSNWEYWRLPDNRFLYVSPSVTSITGYSAEEFMTCNGLLHSIIHPEDHELFLHHTHETDSHGQILPIEIRIISKNGDIRWINHVCQQVFTHNGIPWGWRASNQDISDRKLVEQELHEQTKELEELNLSLEERIKVAVTELRQKDQALIQQSRLAAMGEMINNIAHQWRQPLNNIGLIIQNIQFSYGAGTITKEEMNDEINKTMDIIIHMSRTIDDFRNFFREDKQKSTFFVGSAIQHALEFVSSALSSRNIKVVFIDDKNISTVGYQNEYAQVLLNIISNTRETCLERGTKAPCIRIRVTSENTRSVVYISDNCGGIADDVMPRIFDPYFTTREPDKGSGIGLYMSKVIIEQNMNGSLTAKNIEDGVEFRIEV